MFKSASCISSTMKSGVVPRRNSDALKFYHFRPDSPAVSMCQAGLPQSIALAYRRFVFSEFLPPTMSRASTCPQRSMRAPLAFARRRTYGALCSHGFDVGLEDFDHGVVVFLPIVVCAKRHRGVLQLLCHLKGCVGVIDDERIRSVPRIPSISVAGSRQHHLPSQFFVVACRRWLFMTRGHVASTMWAPSFCRRGQCGERGPCARMTTTASFKSGNSLRPSRSLCVEDMDAEGLQVRHCLRVVDEGPVGIDAPSGPGGFLCRLARKLVRRRTPIHMPARVALKSAWPYNTRYAQQLPRVPRHCTLRFRKGAILLILQNCRLEKGGVIKH